MTGNASARSPAGEADAGAGKRRSRGKCKVKVKVNDGVNLNVAVQVKVVVKINVEDKVEDCRNRSVLLDRPLHLPAVRASRTRASRTRARAHVPAAVSDEAAPVIERGHACTAHVRTGTGHRVLPEWLCTSSAPPRVEPTLPHRRDPTGTRRDPKNRKGAAAIHRCAHNEHDRSTVGVSIPYACA